jgi:hypothetical protein
MRAIPNERLKLEILKPTFIPSKHARSTAMNHPASYQLSPRGMLRLPAGSRLSCDSGNLWITEDHQVHDTVIGPGEAFEPVADGALLVYAFTPAQLHTH